MTDQRNHHNLVLALSWIFGRFQPISPCLNPPLSRMCVSFVGIRVESYSFFCQLVRTRCAISTNQLYRYREWEVRPTSFFSRDGIWGSQTWGDWRMMWVCGKDDESFVEEACGVDEWKEQNNLSRIYQAAFSLDRNISSKTDVGR